MTNISRKSEAFFLKNEAKLIMSTISQKIENPNTLESRLIKKVSIHNLEGELLYTFPDGYFKTSSYSKRIVSRPVCYDNFFILASKETTKFSDTKEVDYNYKAISYKGELFDSITGKWTGDENKIKEYNKLALLARKQRQFEEYGDWQ